MYNMLIIRNKGCIFCKGGSNMPLIIALKHNQHGFYFIEFLIIVSIFGLLAILLIPGLLTTKNKAHQEEKKQYIINKLHTVKLSLEKFHHHSGYYPICNLPVTDQSSPQFGTLKELLNHYSKLNKWLNQKISQPNRYYYYAPANTKISTITTFSLSQTKLDKKPLQGAQQFIIIYNGQHQYYKSNSYNSKVTSISKKETKAAQQNQLIKLLKF